MQVKAEEVDFEHNTVVVAKIPAESTSTLSSGSSVKGVDGAMGVVSGVVLSFVEEPDLMPWKEVSSEGEPKPSGLNLFDVLNVPWDSFGGPKYLGHRRSLDCSSRTGEVAAACNPMGLSGRTKISRGTGLLC